MRHMMKNKEDHPRVGGEKGVQLGKVGLGLGSPPRGRGKVACMVAVCAAGRITPAWAGKSQLRQAFAVQH